MQREQLVAGKCLYNLKTGENYKILYLDWPENIIYAVELGKTIAYPVALAAGKILESDMEVRDDEIDVRDVSTASPKQREELESRWALIRAFVLDEPACYQKKVRSTFAAETAKREECTVYRINQMLYRYWSGGKRKEALLPDLERRGGRGKTKQGTVGRKYKYDSQKEIHRITEDDLKNIREAVNKTYNKHQKYSFVDGYYELLKKYRKKGKDELEDTYPTKNQFTYHARQMISALERYGIRTYNKDIKGHVGSSEGEARGPGDKYQVDATIGDVYLVSASDPTKVIGRPVIYSVADVFSRTIVGIHVGLNAPSWAEARIALFNAFTDKVEYCRYYGITIQDGDWPCKGVPHAVLADNGEFNSAKSDELVMGLGVSIENAPPWRADLKGIVEQSFRQLNLPTKPVMPGAVIKPNRTRGDENYKLSAKLTLYEYTQILIYTVLARNADMMQRQPITSQDYIEAGIPPIPNEIWKWGMENRTGCLTVKTKEELWIGLLPRVQGVIQKQGIRYKKVCFVCDTAVKQRWFDREGGRISERCTLILNPNDMMSCYVVLPSGKLERAVRASATENAYIHWTKYDMDYYINQENAAQRLGEQAKNQRRLDYNQKIEAIINQAEARSKEAISKTRTKRAVTGKEIRSNRREEQAKVIAFPEAAVEGALDDQKEIQEPQMDRQQEKKEAKTLNEKLKKLMEEDELE